MALSARAAFVQREVMDEVPRARLAVVLAASAVVLAAVAVNVVAAQVEVTHPAADVTRT